RPRQLVRQGQRADGPRELGPRVRGHHLPRLQPDLLPAVRARLPRHAAPLLVVSGRVPGAERAVDRRRVDPGPRLRAAHVLPRLVAALRRAGTLEPVGRDRPRVADAVAPAARELRADPGRHAPAVRLPRPGGAGWLTTRPPSTTSRTSSTKIGRASCRERVEMLMRGGS